MWKIIRLAIKWLYLIIFNWSSHTFSSMVSEPKYARWAKLLNPSHLFCAARMTLRSASSLIYSSRNMVRTTRPSSRKAKYSLFFQLAVPSLHKMVDGWIRPARIDCATCSMSGKWQAIKSQSIASLVKRASVWSLVKKPSHKPVRFALGYRHAAYLAEYPTCSLSAHPGYTQLPRRHKGWNAKTAQYTCRWYGSKQCHHIRRNGYDFLTADYFHTDSIAYYPR